MMRDGMIVGIAAMARELQDEFKLEVTLTVGGFLVSGNVISHEAYCALHPFSANWQKNLEKVEQELRSDDVAQPDSEPSDNTPQFIHLGNAHFFSGAHQPIPGNGTAVRILISNVQAFSFGRLKADPQP